MTWIMFQVPGGPAHKQLEPDDVLVHVNGEVITQFLKLETLLDDSVDNNIDLEIERGGLPLIVNLVVDMVIIPASTGQMGVLPGHVATIAELKPRILSVHEGSEITKYFLSSGFAFVHPNSVADIVAIEAVPIDKIDLDQVQKGLAEFTQKLNLATTDLEKAALMFTVL